MKIINHGGQKFDIDDLVVDACTVIANGLEKLQIKGLYLLVVLNPEESLNHVRVASNLKPEAAQELFRMIADGDNPNISEISKH